MIGIILISHGKLAGALKAAAEMILGPLELFEPVEFIEGMTPEALHESLSRSIEKIQNPDGILFLADLFGGTPARVIGEFVLTHEYPAIAGVNLPMLLEICTMRSCASVEEIKAAALEGGRKSIIDINQAIKDA